jgi:hypothetical protein
MYLAARRVFRSYRNSPGLDSLTRIEFPMPSMIQIPEMFVGSHSDAIRCAYCHEQFEQDSIRRFCIFCGTAAHKECLDLNGGCSVYGCIAKDVVLR